MTSTTTATSTMLQPIRQPRGPVSSAPGGFSAYKSSPAQPPSLVQLHTQATNHSQLRRWLRPPASANDGSPTPTLPLPHRYQYPPAGVPVEGWMGAILDVLISSKRLERISEPQQSRPIPQPAAATTATASSQQPSQSQGAVEGPKVVIGGREMLLLARPHVG